jgi:hypothetical protein
MAEERTTGRRTINWRAAVWAGVIAGAVFMMLEMVMMPLFAGVSAWAPPRMIAAILLGREVLPPPATFELGVFLVAMMVHFALSIIYAVILAWIIYTFSLGPAIAIGMAFGLALYVINFYGFTAIFPWFAMARNWISIFAHLVFGGVAAWAYKALEHPVTRTGRVGRSRLAPS